ncbi:MAG: hypothetical protein QXF12_04870 [Candidatus Aenigmatarchaeota archaeon]
MENVFWLFVVIMIISFLSYLYLFLITLNEIRDILSVIYFSVVCSKDEDGDYFLAQKTDGEFCKDLENLDKFSEMECSVLYGKSYQISSCEKTKEIIYNRKGDCIDFAFNGIRITSVKNHEVDEVCKKLN